MSVDQSQISSPITSNHGGEEVPRILGYTLCRIQDRGLRQHCYELLTSVPGLENIKFVVARRP
jgi:hypothetical protein